MSNKLNSPIQKLSGFSDNYNVFIKREDLIHQEYGGNKWRKLKFNIDYFKRNGYETLITFGGPFSNHIAATAAVCRDNNINNVGIIRGNYVDPSNPTLNKAKADGMKLYHVSKDSYSHKKTASDISKIIDTLTKPFVIPEGGSNNLALLGMEELMKEIEESAIEFNYICVAAGTGSTSSGMIKYNASNAELIIVNALKNQSLKESIQENIGDDTKSNWRIWSAYHCGGFAKVNAQLRAFVKDFQNNYQIDLDPLYNSKMLFALNSELRKNSLEKGSNILCIHTGGIQGIRAFEYANKKRWIEE